MDDLDAAALERLEQRSVELAALMLVHLGVQHDLTDNDMHRAVHDSLRVQFEADQKEPLAVEFAAQASERLVSVWRGIEIARRDKTVN